MKSTLREINFAARTSQKKTYIQVQIFQFFFPLRHETSDKVRTFK